MKVAGYTYKQIGESLGVSRQRAQQYLRIIGHPTNGSCESCGKISAIIHCHHDDYRTNEFRLLCVSCHTREHPLKKKRLKDRKHKYRRPKFSSILAIGKKLREQETRKNIP